MKIDKTQEFTVDRGTDAELEKTWNIIKANGIPFYNECLYFSDWLKRYSKHVIRFTNMVSQYNTFGSQNEKHERNYTPSEFHAKYGDVLTPKYPFELVGDVIEVDGAYWKEVDKSISILLTDGITFKPSPFFKDEKTKLIAIISGRPLPFIQRSNAWASAWVEVDPPEPKMVTREMTAQEIVALGDIWVMIGDASYKLYRSELCLDPNGDLQFHGRLTKHCRYSYSPDATEWLPFTVTEPAK